MASILLDKLSRSSSYQSSKEALGEAGYQWESIKIYSYLAFAYSSSTFNADIFSQIKKPVRLIDFIIVNMISTMSYAFMDFFVKMYTGSLDFNKTLNPLLKGVTYGMLLQSMLFTILYANELTDALRYLIASLHHVPAWTVCHKDANNCISIPDVLTSCRRGKVTHIGQISVEHNYRETFLLPHTDITEKFFVNGMIWVINFFIATVTFNTIIKILRLSFILSITSTIFTAIFIFIIKSELILIAIKDILNVNFPVSNQLVIDHLTSPYRVGLIGVYDFNTMSPFTKINNAIVVFTMVYTSTALLRSLIFRMVYLSMLPCVKLPKKIRSHYSLFVVIPMGIEFLHAQKLFAIYLYLNSVISLIANITLATTTIARLLHSQFRKVKDVYIVGLLCFVGFVVCLAFTTIFDQMTSLKISISINMLYLGTLKSIIIMWVYGVKRFTTDIEFWLGFKPTIYWKLTWMFLPITLSYFLTLKIYNIYQKPFDNRTIIIIAWYGVTAMVVLAFHIKTISSYMMANNLVAAFRSSIKYGPPDPDLRRSRRKYNEATHFQQCEHNCMILDDRLDCMHEPIAFRLRTGSGGSQPSEQAASMTNIYAGDIITKRQSSLMEIKSTHVD